MSTGLGWLDGWLASGGAVDWILGAMVVEALLLVAWRARTGHGLPPRQLMATIVAGGGLMLALRFALVDPSATGPIAFGLLVALAAHVADIRMRWGRA